ncbi:MAG: hypothetical protein FJ385_09315 [Verrucomicrobia bacterium]|nr:hypothetical protein [Verrucomicrobiota bacterium]
MFPESSFTRAHASGQRLLDAAALRVHRWRVRTVCSGILVGLWWSTATGLMAQPAAATAAPSEAVVQAERPGPEVAASALAAVAKLGEEVVQGRYLAALERMNPQWKERTAARMGGMKALETQLAGVAEEMVRQGVRMLSFKPQGEPRVLEVSPGTSRGGNLVYTKWLVLVPTVSRVRLLQQSEGQAARQVTIESTGYQVAIADKGAADWTFIDGAGLTAADLRGLFGTLPAELALPPVLKRIIP